MPKRKRGKGPILAIPDLHAPFTHAAALDHTRGVFSDWGCTEAVFLGDVLDLHALGFYDSDPDGHGASLELDMARAALKPWIEAWPKAKVCLGNHDARIYRKAMKHGFPRELFRSLASVLEAPHWDFQLRHEIDGVLYIHGTNYSGITAHKRAAERNRQSVVMGHVHAHAGVAYLASPKDLIFGVNSGCLIDRHAYAMNYAKELDTKPVLGCTVVVSSREAHFIPMEM